MRLLGVDFTSAPSRRKPITAAWGRLSGSVVKLDELVACPDFEGFDALLREPGPWVGAFDLPFGLPRELVEHLGWPTDWAACITHYAGLSREAIRERFAAFCAARPVGGKFAHRATDGPAGSSPSMKWVNPPVAWMLHAGVPRLRAAGLHLPGVQPAALQPPGPPPDDAPRVALEGYPGLLARELLGSRSYKSDDAARQTPQRLIARKDLVDALEQGRSRLGLRLRLSHAQRERLVDDARGDTLDAVLCLLQAGWAAVRGAPRYGLPEGIDPLEGWIVTAVPG